MKSEVPNTSLHYLLIDIDDRAKYYRTVRDWKTFPFGFPITHYPTPNGGHIINWKPRSFADTIRILAELMELGIVDKNHLKIGIGRGYWFLDSHMWNVAGAPELMGLKVQYMRIEA